MNKKILIANRGEIALRILRTCKDLGIKTVAIYSDIDKNLMHVKLSDEKICIGPNSALKSYLNIATIIAAAEISNSYAIHPGYGFLSENANFAKSVEESGIVFIGPKPKDIKIMGDKIVAIETMKKSGISCIPGSNGLIKEENIKKNMNIANKIGYPVIIKASKGGGGRGMRIVNKEKDLKKCIQMTKNEAKMTFKNDSIYMEKLLTKPKHIEIQVFGDGKGKAIHLFERDCSIQRRHQKIIEEAPAHILDNVERQQIGKKCINCCKYIKYRGPGTFEFLYEKKNFYFIEMNTRIQVEHPISEEITNIDIIKKQILLSFNQKLNFKQKNIKIKGHSIECRINAEDPYKMLPCPGKIDIYHPPGGSYVRVDSHIYSKYFIPSNYDSMIAKIIVHSENRNLAIQKMKNAIDELIIKGVKTNISIHKKILYDKDFYKGKTNIHYLEKLLNK